MGKGLIPIILLLFLTACLPPPAQYPYKPADVLFSEADSLSDKLSQYIDDWIAGKRPAEIPDSILPVGIDSTKNRHFFLQKFEEIHPDSQWIYRSAGELDFKGLKKGFYDPHATYLFLSTALAPFGDELVIEGEYPYCRFFSIQLSAPLDGKTYCAAGTYGPAETSVADIDIPAMQGSENPFVTVYMKIRTQLAKRNVMHPSSKIKDLGGKNLEARARGTQEIYVFVTMPQIIIRVPWQEYPFLRPIMCIKMESNTLYNPTILV